MENKVLIKMKYIFYIIYSNEYNQINFLCNGFLELVSRSLSRLGAVRLLLGAFPFQQCRLIIQYYFVDGFYFEGHISY